MTDMDLSQYVDLLKTVCSEDFGPWPLYILDRAEVPKMAWPDGAGGFTCMTLDIELRDHLTAVGRWAGRGYAMVLDVAGYPPDGLAGLVCHEAGHWLTSPQPIGSVESLRSLCTAAGWQGTESLAVFLGSVPQLPLPTPWFDHGLDFIRCCLHLWGRWPAGLALDSLPVAGGPYNLSPVWAYYFRLDEELHRSSGSIRKILAEAEPPGFAALFARDTTD